MNNQKSEDLIFTYQWHCVENDNITQIKVFGVDKNNKNVYLCIDNFTPYIYLELPNTIDWNKAKSQLLCNKIDEMCSSEKPLKKTLVFKKKLYYANKVEKNGKLEDILFPFLCLTFSSSESIKKFSYRLKKKFFLPGVGYITTKIHESNASPVLQLTSFKNISPTGWISFKGSRVSESDKESFCDREYLVDWRDIKGVQDDSVGRPLVLSFDIEVNSSNPNAMPNANKINDKVFQISCVLGRQGCAEKEYEKYLLTLGNPDPKIVGEDIFIRTFSCEATLLEGFAEFIQEKNPNIILGYNIFQFDIPYMLKRSVINLCDFKFKQQSFIKGEPGEVKKISWSSSAYKNQEFEFLDCNGRLYVDALPIIRRDYNFDTYSLKNVSTHFLGQTKDPLTPKGIFKCYRLFTPNSLGVVGKYCVQDSALVLKLFEHLQMWVGLCEMSRICNTRIFSLYTQGQQLKIFSQIYKVCMYQNYVVEKDGYVCKENERYTGAYVFDPVPGVYDMVVSFDFSSLYPSTIIAYNIDYTTLVIDESIPDEKCNIFEWEDHLGCEHDKTARKTKPKSIVCGYNKFRFLKEPKGIVPTLLENLLNSRKRINGDIAKIKEQLKTLEDDDKKKEMQSLMTVLDKRQLAMKISANSVYGGFGVRRGYLPFMPGAMCTTARGRESIEKAAKHVQENYGAKLIYGDTDSCYVSFPQFKSEKDARECYDFCKQVEEDMLSIFPRPMKFAYEEKIYWRFFILTKKRYMALQCDKKGIISNNIFKRGVLLNRRDSNKILRKIYSELMLKIFFKEDKNSVLYYIIEEILKLFQLVYSPKEFVSTKSVGKNEDYKIRELPEDDKKREKRLKELNCTKEEYRFRCLPAQVQLAEKMRKRGKRVDPGSRLEFVITDKGGLDANLFDKIEDVEYFMDHREVLRLDYFYYLNLFINPIDQVIQTAYGDDKFLKNQYNCMIKKYKMLGEMKNFVRPKLEFL